MWLELLTLIIGIAFGFFHHGKEDYKGLLKNSVIAGIVMSIIFVLVSMFLFPGGLSISLGILGMFGLFIIIVIFVILFIVGAFIGDWLERVLKK
ncbi:hypothetical protein [Methanoregula sp.]|uniref:hypothetical protein n=1 Tax=Methanoregula sp. TaxID=2052170 RepID=UPI0035693D6D